MGLESARCIRFHIPTGLLIAVMLLTAGCGGSNDSLTPADGAGDSQPSPKMIRGSGDKPVSVPDAFPRQGGVPLLIHLWDGGSYDPDGEIVMWEWNFSGAGGGWLDYTETQGDAWHQYDKPGNRQAHLRVTDNDGNKDVEHVTIKMRRGYNANPVAVASVDPTFGNAPLTVQFSAAGSYDPDGEIVMWEWDVGDGSGFIDSTDTGGELSHEYTLADDYTAILRVTDDDAAERTDSVEIIVEPPLAGRGDWWMYGHDAAHTRRSQYVGAQTNTFKWSYSTGGVLYSSPAIAADGTVYIGCRDHKLYAVNADGTLKWSYATGGIVYSSPAIGADGTVYVGSDDFKLYAINPDGSLKWSYVTGGFVWTSPAIAADGTVYVGSCRDYKLYAINADGTFKWSYATGGDLYSSPAIGADGTVYLGSCDDKLHAINADGTFKWSYTTGGDVQSSPAIGADGTVYVGCRDHNLYAVNADGTLKWSYATGGDVWSSPAIGADGTVYLGSHDKKLHAVNADGSPKWVYTTGNVILWPSPAIGADGTVYVGSYDHNLYAINADGTLKWSYATGDIVWSSPAIGVDGTVYVGSHDFKLYAIGP